MIQSIFIILFLILTFPITAHADLGTGQVGWWKFNESSGSTAADASGNGNTANITGTPTWAQGKIGNALHFDGSTTTAIGVNDVNSLFYNHSWTISMWVNMAVPTNAQTFYNTDFSIINGHMYQFAGQGYLRFRILNCTDVDSPGAVYSADTWYFLTYVYDLPLTKATSYLNGALSATSGTLGCQITNQFQNFNIGGTDFAGLIDDVRIYQRALSASEVAQLYNVGKRVFKNAHLRNMKSTE